MGHNKKYSTIKQQIQMVGFYTETKSTLLTPVTFVKHFVLDRKHMASPQNKPS